jgi:hypothetical protein
VLERCAAPVLERKILSFRVGMFCSAHLKAFEDSPEGTRLLSAFLEVNPLNRQIGITALADFRARMDACDRVEFDRADFNRRLTAAVLP